MDKSHYGASIGNTRVTDLIFADDAVILYRLRQFFSPAQKLSIYRGLVRPRMEYASHVWRGSTHTALLDRVESKALRLISSPPLRDSFLPLKFHRHVASLFIFYRYFHADCSSELANCMPPPPPADSPHTTFYSSPSLYCPNP